MVIVLEIISSETSNIYGEYIVPLKAHNVFILRRGKKKHLSLIHPLKSDELDKQENPSNETSVKWEFCNWCKQIWAFMPNLANAVTSSCQPFAKFPSILGTDAKGCSTPQSGFFTTSPFRKPTLPANITFILRDLTFIPVYRGRWRVVKLDTQAERQNQSGLSNPRCWDDYLHLASAFQKEHFPSH